MRSLLYVFSIVLLEVKEEVEDDADGKDDDEDRVGAAQVKAWAVLGLDMAKQRSNSWNKIDIIL